MKDLVGDQVSHYLYQFYYHKNPKILLSELYKIIISKDEDYKLDKLYIEKALEERGFLKEIEQVYVDAANYKEVHKIDFTDFIDAYRPVLLKKNRKAGALVVGGFLFFSVATYLIPDNLNVINGISFILTIPFFLCLMWVIIEPILTRVLLPIIYYTIDYIGLVIKGLAELISMITGTLKKWSLFYDNEKDKPLISKRNKLEPTDVAIIEEVLGKKELTEQQARFYLDALLSVKNNISNNLS